MSGRELKLEAIAQGAQVQLGFDLWINYCSGWRPVYDECLTTIDAEQDYLAITSDDHGPPLPAHPAQQPSAGHGAAAEGWSLELPPRLRCALPAHLLRDDGGTHAWVILAEQPDGPYGRRLIGTVFIPAIDTVDYIEGSTGYAWLDPEFIRDAIVRAWDHQWAYLTVHNHHNSATGFSHIDLASHERGYPTLGQITRQLVGGLVLTEHTMTGDLWLPNGTRAPLATVEPFPSP